VTALKTDSTDWESTVGGTPSWNPFEALLEGVWVARSQPIVIGLFLIATIGYGFAKMIRDSAIEDPLLGGLGLVGALAVMTAALGLTHRYAAVARFGGPTDVRSHLRAMAWFVPMAFAVEILLTLAVTVVIGIPAVVTLVTDQWVFVLMGLPVAIYCLLRLSFAIPAVTIDGQEPIPALVQSWMATKGQVARLFVVIVVGAIIGALDGVNGLQYGSVTYAAVVSVVGMGNCFVQLGIVHAYLETADPPEWADSE